MSENSTVEYRAEELTHRHLWLCVQNQLEIARTREANWYFHLTAMVMAYFVFEAYLNYLGEIFDKETWATEREFFSKEPYRGTEGKLKKLLELCDLPFPDKNTRPFASVVQLGALRDAIVHARPFKSEFKVTLSPRAPMPHGKIWLQNAVNDTQAERTIADIEEFLENLHATFVQADRYALPAFALKGSIVYGGAWVPSR